MPLPIVALIGIGELAMLAMTSKGNGGSTPPADSGPLDTTTSATADTVSDPAPTTAPTQQDTSTVTNTGIPWGDGWMWPVPPALYSNGVEYQPTISQEWRAGSHLGVDVMYQRKDLSDRPEDKSGTEAGTKVFFTPPGTPIVAAKDGTVWSADLSPRGHQVVIDHGKPFATYYQHLTTVEGGIVKGAQVKAGDVIGTMGGDPLDAPQHLRHLHFAVWYNGAGDAASVDPQHEMYRAWAKARPWTPVTRKLGITVAEVDISGSKDEGTT